MVEWHHRFNGHELVQTLGDSEGQGSLESCSLWGREESDTTWRLNNNDDKCKALFLLFTSFFCIRAKTEVQQQGCNEEDKIPSQNPDIHMVLLLLVIIKNKN